MTLAGFAVIIHPNGHWETIGFEKAENLFRAAWEIIGNRLEPLLTKCNGKVSAYVSAEDWTLLPINWLATTVLNFLGIDLCTCFENVVRGAALIVMEDNQLMKYEHARLLTKICAWFSTFDSNKTPRSIMEAEVRELVPFGMDTAVWGISKTPPPS